MDAPYHPDESIRAAGARLAELLTGGGGDGLRDPRGGAGLVFEPELALRPLVRGPAPADVWAVDGGQALVADARCLQVYVTRAARVRWQPDAGSVLEDEGAAAGLAAGARRGAPGAAGIRGAGRGG